MSARLLFSGFLLLPALAPSFANPTAPAPPHFAGARNTTSSTSSSFVPGRLPPFTVQSAPPAPTVASAPFPRTDGIPGEEFGLSLTTIGDLTGDGSPDVVIGGPYVNGPLGYEGAVFPFDGKPNGSFVAKPAIRGPEPYCGFGYSTSTSGDVNGDGLQDLLVGAPYITNGNPNEGRAYLYLGTPSGVSNVPVWIFEPNADFAQAGFSVSFAGDLNGDGFDDWAIGAPGFTDGQSFEGAVFVFAGGSGALSTTPVRTLETNVVNASLGFSVSTAGDVNGDGYDDLVVGAPYDNTAFTHAGAAYLWLGSGSFPVAAYTRRFAGDLAESQLGFSVGVIGDANGDGYSDFALGEPSYDGVDLNRGRVNVVLGGPFPASYAQSPYDGVASNDQFGTAVATAGDYNGDGYADLLVGAPHAAGGAANSGVAYLYRGSPDGIVDPPFRTFNGGSTGIEFGQSVATMGDVNADGLSDIMIGFPLAGIGNAIPLFGQTEIVLGFHFAGQGFVPGEDWGLSGAAGDFNGDGYDDLALGTPYANGAGPNVGRVDVFNGGPHPFPDTGPYPYVNDPPDFEYTGSIDFETIGQSLCSAGDINGDGFDDLVMGSYVYTNGEENEGEAIVLYGSVNGLTTENVWKVESNIPFAYFGYSVAGGGDLNGDGYADVAIGAEGIDNGGGANGQVFVYLGSPLGLSHQPWKILPASIPGDFGYSVAIVGDVNRDGIDDLAVGAPEASDVEAYEGRLYLYYGSKTSLTAAPPTEIQIDHANAWFGAGVAGVGDVNGDGYADVAAAAPHFSDTFSQQGKVLIYPGSPAGLSSTSIFEKLGASNDEMLGTGPNAIGRGGDFNADGYGDFVVGSPYLLNSPHAYAGIAAIYPGGPTPGTIPLTGLVAGVDNTYLGYVCVGDADFDGDGHTDFAMTAPGAGFLGSDEGILVVMYGDAFDAPNAPDHPVYAARSDGTARIGTGMRSNSNNSFRLKGLGRTIAGRSRTRLQWEVKPTATPFDLSGLGASGWLKTGGIVPGAGSSLPMSGLVSGLAPATSYHWRARWQSHSPYFQSSPWFTPRSNSLTERDLFTGGAPLAVGVDPPAPAGVALLGATPNPSTHETSVAFTLPHTGRASVSLYDVNGRRVRALFDGAGVEGRNSVTWDGRDDAGRRVPAGAYFMRLIGDGEERVAKIVRLD